MNRAGRAANYPAIREFAIPVGGQLAEILFFGAVPGYPGYYQVNFRAPGGVAPGSAVSVRLTDLGRPGDEITVGSSNLRAKI